MTRSANGNHTIGGEERTDYPRKIYCDDLDYLLIMTLVLFSGTMLAAILGALLGSALGALLDGFVTSLLQRKRRGVDEGWSVTAVIRGALWGTVPGLLLGGYFGFLFLVAWLET